MDYSMLLGIHHVTEHRTLREERSGGLTRRASLTSRPVGELGTAAGGDAPTDGTAYAQLAHCARSIWTVPRS